MTGDEALSDVGIGWSQGPLSLAVAYGAHEKDAAPNKVVTSLGAGYNLGPGIDFGAKFNMVENGADESTEIILGTTSTSNVWLSVKGAGFVSRLLDQSFRGRRCFGTGALSLFL